MKQLIRKTAVMMSFILMICLFAGCNGSAGDKDKSSSPTVDASVFVGTWKGTGNETATLTFSADGKMKDVTNLDGTVYSITGTYTVDSEECYVYVTEDEYGLNFAYHYTISGNDLTLQMEGGLPRTFRKS